MKLIKILFVFMGMAVAAKASTISLSGGTTGHTFGYSYVGSADFVVLSTADTTIRVGSLTDTGSFTQFAPGDTTPPSLVSASGPLYGKWSGNASDNSDAANAFNGLAVWFEISTTIDGQEFTLYTAGVDASGAQYVFPTNAGGVGDTLAISSASLSIISEFSTGEWVIENGRVSLVNVIPEPSTTLLGALGALALLRRRRH